MRGPWWCAPRRIISTPSIISPSVRFALLFYRQSRSSSGQPPGHTLDEREAKAGVAGPAVDLPHGYSVPLPDVDEMTGDGCRGSHGGRHEMGAALETLASF